MTELGEPASTVGMVPVGVGEAPVVAADTVVPAGCAGAAMPPSDGACIAMVSRLFALRSARCLGAKIVPRSSSKVMLPDLSASNVRHMLLNEDGETHSPSALNPRRSSFLDSVWLLSTSHCANHFSISS